MTRLSSLFCIFLALLAWTDAAANNCSCPVAWGDGPISPLCGGPTGVCVVHGWPGGDQNGKIVSRSGIAGPVAYCQAGAIASAKFEILCECVDFNNKYPKCSVMNNTFVMAQPPFAGGIYASCKGSSFLPSARSQAYGCH